jgi:hypothetical protein
MISKLRDRNEEDWSQILPAIITPGFNTQKVKKAKYIL